MQVFRIALRLIRNSWPLFAIYVLALSVMGVLMGESVGYVESDGGGFQEELPRAAVIDRDGSEVSQALEAFVRSESTYVELEDSTYALQDAAARDVASYVLVIPEGWGEDMLAAAREGTDAPALETIVSYSGADGTLMDERVRGWAQELYALAAASDARKSLIGTGDRSEKIRTYNFPQDRITDHRIHYSRSNVTAAMDGEIDDLIRELTLAERAQVAEKL